MDKKSEDNSLLRKVCTRTTCHGPYDFYQAQGAGRLFWVAVTLCAFVGIGYYAYQLVDNYLQNPLATSITNVPQAKLLFPNVTICNPARYNATYVLHNTHIPPGYTSSLAQIPITEASFKREFFRYLRVLSWSVEHYDKDESRTQRLVEGLQMLYDHMFNGTANANAQNIGQFLSQATFDCPQYLVDCRFEQEPFDCCQAARKTFIDNGYCYTIDVGTNGSEGYQTSEGEDNGLHVTVRMNMNDILLMSDTEELGLRVHVEPYATTMAQNPVGVPLSVHAHVRLRPVHYILNKDADQCVDRGRPLDPYETYTPTLCEMKCLDDMILSLCDCLTLGSFVERDPQSICSPLTMLTCIYPRLMGKSNDSIDAMNDLLACYSTQCPKLCDWWSYSTYIMSTTINPNPTNSDETVTTKLSIYFPEMVYEEHQEQLLTDVTTFVSNIGGVVGLWTGMSVLTLIQFILILIFGPCEDKGGCCGFGRKEK